MQPLCRHILVIANQHCYPGRVEKALIMAEKFRLVAELKFVIPVPILTNLIGGAEADSKAALPSSVTWGQASSEALPLASDMAKARQVGAPQSLQLVLGKCL